eukprot:TRINITY_DN7368_c0_g1_i1.p1 TRINITY_DN7368_c0_g1~~TRINITY_DN7368_c0_g1_i1.p1  ORF type:complete len:838 (-),score=143.73 TRINITY_DN7368_c0_g1_i1:630-3143(-)
MLLLNQSGLQGASPALLKAAPPSRSQPSRTCGSSCRYGQMGRELRSGMSSSTAPSTSANGRSARSVKGCLKTVVQPGSEVSSEGAGAQSRSGDRIVPAAETAYRQGSAETAWEGGDSSSQGTWSSGTSANDQDNSTFPPSSAGPGVSTETASESSESPVKEGSANTGSQQNGSATGHASSSESLFALISKVEGSVIEPSVSDSYNSEKSQGSRSMEEEGRSTGGAALYMNATGVTPEPFQMSVPELASEVIFTAEDLEKIVAKPEQLYREEPEAEDKSNVSTSDGVPPVLPSLTSSGDAKQGPPVVSTPEGSSTPATEGQSPPPSSETSSSSTTGNAPRVTRGTRTNRDDRPPRKGTFSNQVRKTWAKGMPTAVHVKPPTVAKSVIVSPFYPSSITESYSPKKAGSETPGIATSQAAPPVRPSERSENNVLAGTKLQARKLEERDPNVDYYEPQKGDEILAVVVAVTSTGARLDIGSYKPARLSQREVSPISLPFSTPDLTFPLPQGPDEEAAFQPPLSRMHVVLDPRDDEVTPESFVASPPNAQAPPGASDVRTGAPPRFPRQLQRAANLLVPPVLRRGDLIPVKVMGGESFEGHTLVSMKNLWYKIAWKRIHQIEAEKEPIQVEIAVGQLSGAICYLEGLRAFIPTSYMRNALEGGRPDPRTMVGQKMNVMIIELIEGEERIILSQMAAIKHQEESETQVGTLVDGEVVSLLDYGALVRLGNAQRKGLLHVSNISRRHVGLPAEAFEVGERIRAIIISNENGRLALSTRDLESADGLILRDKQRVWDTAEQMAEVFRDDFAEEIAEMNRDVPTGLAVDFPPPPANLAWLKFDRDL